MIANARYVFHNAAFSIGNSEPVDVTAFSGARAFTDVGETICTQCSGFQT